ncbi:MAG: hypothetical protein MI867_19965 [Pseudomonadales bacterium]|nr:hypothetical protein [Pseudomonadales bacterium]
MKRTHQHLAALVGLSFIQISTPTFAEDWTLSAPRGCITELGTTTESGGGLKASGGTAVVLCPITKEGGYNTINAVYARINRALSNGPDPFCTLSTTSNYGSPTDMTWGFASDGAGNKSISLPLGDQYSYGYASVSCVLNVNDTFYGIRYLQDN